MANEKETCLVGACAQGYANAIEGVMRTAFSCDRGGLGGVADSDYIRMQPFEAIEEALRYRFPDCRSDDYKKASAFLGEFDGLKGQAIDDIVKSEIGAESLDEMVEAFRCLLCLRGLAD